VSLYDHKKIEKKWQKEWEAKDVYRTKKEPGEKKFYVLDMFPYPSGSGLHVGHPRGYTATDVYSRYKRMNGFDVLHPMGWDAFGLPAENYAIKTNTHPKEITEQAINTFRKQIQDLGLSYDWDREIDTHSPEYYKWTQWIFLKLYEKGLAYKKKAPVNWDPVDQTVLANEQVLPDGTAERSGAKVVKKDLEQWFFKITDYADELIDGLDKVDWPESTVKNQKNWIGRSNGAEIEFSVKDSSEKIKVFTTRPDTLFGATYVVLSPEHKLVDVLSGNISNWDEVSSYIEEAKNKTEIDRTSEDKEKTGVVLNGLKVVNPANKEELPIFIADYVLAHYGTGAIMAVPAHDDRDLQFAIKFGLDIKPVIAQVNSESEIKPGFTEAKIKSMRESGFAHTGDGFLFNSGKFDGLSSEDAKKAITEFVGGKLKVTYKLRDWLVSRQRYWGAPIPIVYDPEGEAHSIPEKHLPWLLPTDVEFMPKGTSPLGSSKELLERTEKIFGKGWKPEIDTMDTFVCSSWYYFRFTDPKNEKEFALGDAIKKWLPVDVYVGGAEHTVLHLMYARFFTKALRDMGYASFDEPFIKLRHPGLIMASDGRKMSKSLGNVINPDEMVETFGADSTRMYEMFMGPFNQPIAWSVDNIVGVRRFIERVWKIKEKVSDDAETSVGAVSLLHKTIKKVSDDIEDFKFNTAVSSLMILVNEFDKQKKISSKDFRLLLKILSPFAPHVSEELWFDLGEGGSVVVEKWPDYDEKKIVSEGFDIAVQVNGKVRGSFHIDSEIGEEEIKNQAMKVESVRKWISGESIKKVIYVENKLVNIVV